VLKDLTRNDWLSALQLDPARAPSVLLLRGTRNMERHYDRSRALFEDVIDVGTPNGLFEHVFVGRCRGRDVGYASVYGASMASEICHLFGALGTETVIQTGVCGALRDGVLAGDLVVASEAGCGEGAAACYFPGIERVAASPDLVDVVRRQEHAVPCHHGPIWSTAALLAEGDAEINLWNEQGFIAVDMESAATLAVAKHFGMNAVSILSVFDNPREGAHLALTEHDKVEARERGEAAMHKTVFDLIERDSS
jgi:purine-nucleoside phosphorylase